ncbi:MAG: hypothetical protein M1826_006498 [Phylliscum demangeonii]|nr:MAG: hypothetical protein M1826_006498 [Phylliscum demangeonii]
MDFGPPMDLDKPSNTPSTSTVSAKAREEDINRNGQNRPQACLRCLIAIVSGVMLQCRVRDPANEDDKCGRCVGMSNKCTRVEPSTGLVDAARILQREAEAVARIASGPEHETAWEALLESARVFKRRYGVATQQLRDLAREGPTATRIGRRTPRPAAAAAAAAEKKKTATPTTKTPKTPKTPKTMANANPHANGNANANAKTPTPKTPTALMTTTTTTMTTAPASLSSTTARPRNAATDLQVPAKAGRPASGVSTSVMQTTEVAALVNCLHVLADSQVRLVKTQEKLAELSTHSNVLLEQISLHLAHAAAARPAIDLPKSPAATEEDGEE